MKTTAALGPVLATVLVLTSVHAQTTRIPLEITTPDTVQTGIGTLEFKDGAPSAETVPLESFFTNQ